MLTREGIRAMGLYLLDTLKAEKSVRFSRLCERFRADGSLAGGFSSGVEKGAEHVDLQEAAWQLKDLGIVRITNLEESLLDPDLFRLAWPEISEEFGAHLQKSHPDFLIELTELAAVTAPAPGAGQRGDAVSGRRPPSAISSFKAAMIWL